MASLVHKVFIGIGSNLAPKKNISKALGLIANEFSDVQSSPCYRTAAVGAATGDFINLVVQAHTRESPRAVIASLKRIEARCGRDHSAAKNTPHTIDLDLLIYDDLVSSEPDLRLPRDDIECYAFVLKPLADLAPKATHPRLQQSYAELWAAFDLGTQSLARIDGIVAA